MGTCRVIGDKSPISKPLENVFFPIQFNLLVFTVAHEQWRYAPRNAARNLQCIPKTEAFFITPSAKRTDLYVYMVLQGCSELSTSSRLSNMKVVADIDHV